MSDIKIDLQESDTWEIQLTTAISFISDPEEESVVLSRSNNIKFTSCNDANEVVDGLFKSLNSRYQGNLKHQ